MQLILFRYLPVSATEKPIPENGFCVSPIYERVKELTVEQVSKNEDLSSERVASIFKRVARRKKM
jgi:hypothetical protein